MTKEYVYTGPLVVPQKIEVSNDMKAKFMGEYSWTEDAPYFDEDGNYVEYEAVRTVPWDLCKQIFKEMAQYWIKEVGRVDWK